MATADECRAALASLTARIARMDAQQREKHLTDRTLSLRVPDLGVTFRTRLGPHGADPISEVRDGEGATADPAQVRFTAKSDDVVAIAADPSGLLGAWMSGRLKVEGNFFDLLQLRKLM